MGDELLDKLRTQNISWGITRITLILFDGNCRSRDDEGMLKLKIRLLDYHKIKNYKVDVKNIVYCDNLGLFRRRNYILIMRDVSVNRNTYTSIFSTDDLDDIEV